MNKVSEVFQLQIKWVAAATIAALVLALPACASPRPQPATVEPGAGPAEPGGQDTTPLPTPTLVVIEAPTAPPTASAPSQSTSTPEATDITGGQIITGEAAVDSVELLMLESFPVQVRAVVSGNLADACTTVDEIQEGRIGNTFQFIVTTQRPADRMCAQVLTPFQETIPVEAAGLPAGSYTVTVNSVSTTFTLDVDNTLSPTPTPS